MKRAAGANESSALRSRHRLFFKRLDAFIKNYAKGVCGEESQGAGLASMPLREDGAGKLR